MLYKTFCCFIFRTKLWCSSAQSCCFVSGQLLNRAYWDGIK